MAETLAIKVPSVGESITEVLIAEILKPVGASVNVDDGVISLETDKVNVDVPAPGTGVITQILKQPGETARVGDIVAYMEVGAAATASAPAAAAAPVVAEAKAGTKTDAAAPRVMPAADRVLAQAGIDPKTVAATGPGGRVLKEDALAAAGKLSDGQKIPLVFAAETAPSAPAKPAATAATSAAKASAPAVAARPAGARVTETVAMSPLRKKVAERLVQAQQTAAILTTFNEVDMSAVMELRKKHQDAFTAKYGVKLGFMSFFVKATVEALKAYPLVNAQIRGTDILYQHFYDVGIAVGGGKGLVVPIIRDADQLSFADLEKVMADYGARAKAGTLKLDELQGGTFSISNGGVYGSMMSTPILNPPQSGILGMHNIVDRPVAINGQVVIRPMMYLALSYDHRLVDGKEAVGFLVRIKQCIEAPERMLLGA
jgi:2-oxoglutarate dehydrogenase E2 component (dihydrolipoamide succinyltransferase)